MAPRLCSRGTLPRESPRQVRAEGPAVRGPAGPLRQANPKNKMKGNKKTEIQIIRVFPSLIHVSMRQTHIRLTATKFHSWRVQNSFNIRRASLREKTF